jgi:branched-chain amino acid aminotransferase
MAHPKVERNTPREQMPAMANGTFVSVGEASVSACDDGLLRGDGAFEVMLVYRGRPFSLLEHLKRLERSCSVLRLPPPDLAGLKDRALRLAATAADLDTCILRVVLTRGGAELLLLEPHRRAVEPISLAFVPYEPQPVLLGAKSLSYAANMLASRLARERGADDALLVWREAYVLVAPTSSFFWVDRDGELCTPPLSAGILDSITRRIVLAGMPASERACSVDAATSAREAFLASTVREIQAVGKIESYRPDAINGEITLAARAVLESEIERQSHLPATAVTPSASDREPF